MFVPSGVSLTYGTLDKRANQAARVLRLCGAGPGDGVVFCVDNSPEFLQIAWGVQRIGVRFKPASTRLGAEDLYHIVRDSGAKILILSAKIECATKLSLDELGGVRLLSLKGEIPGFVSWEGQINQVDDTAIENPTPGREMMYSSGTTGRGPINPGILGNSGYRDAGFLMRASQHS